MAGHHKNDTASYRELDFKEQALSFNAYMSILTDIVKVHIEKGISEGKNSNEIKNKCISQLERLIERIRDL